MNSAQTTRSKSSQPKVDIDSLVHHPSHQNTGYGKANRVDFYIQEHADQKEGQEKKIESSKRRPGQRVDFVTGGADPKTRDEVCCHAVNGVGTRF